MLTAVGLQGLQLKPLSLAVLSLLGSAIDAAVGILSKYGGSLWVADSAYSFTNTDGTGVTADNSDVGYVRDLCGNARPLTQATTGFKPKLKRVPKKLGPELVENGTFDADITGWYRAGTTGDGSIGWSAGKLQCTRLTADAMAQTTMAGVAAGKQYQVSVTGSGAGFSVGSIDASIRNFADGTVASFTASATSKNLRVWPSNTNSTVLFDNISVREVLEWTWAWVFDGVDDLLATVSQATATEETLVVCKDSVRKTSGAGAYMLKRGGGVKGVWMYTDTNGDNGLAAGNGTAWQYNGFTPPGNPTKLVMSAVTSATQVKKRTNALNTVNSFSYASGAGPVSVGGYIGAFANATVFAAAYAPAAIPDTELLIVEQALGQLAGLTL